MTEKQREALALADDLWKWSKDGSTEEEAAFELRHQHARIIELEALLSQPAEHICNLWVDPSDGKYVVDHCNHPPYECFPVYRRPQPGWEIEQLFNIPQPAIAESAEPVQLQHVTVAEEMAIFEALQNINDIVSSLQENGYSISAGKLHDASKSIEAAASGIHTTRIKNSYSEPI